MATNIEASYTRLNIQPVQPEYLRIPRPRERDPIWGQSRAFWYEAEKRGLIQFKRIRLSGGKNGITMIPVNEARGMIEKLIDAEPAVHVEAAHR